MHKTWQNKDGEAKFERSGTKCFFFCFVCFWSFVSSFCVLLFFVCVFCLCCLLFVLIGFFFRSYSVLFVSFALIMFRLLLLVVIVRRGCSKVVNASVLCTEGPQFNPGHPQNENKNNFILHKQTNKFEKKQIRRYRQATINKTKSTKHTAN